MPRGCQPQTLEDAYVIQDTARPLIATIQGQPVGWKIGCTTKVMQGYLGLTHPCAGTLYANTVFDNHVALVHEQYLQLGLECEIAVELKRSLAAEPVADRSLKAAKAAIGAVMLSVEIVEHRFSDFAKAGTASLIADDFFSVGCVLGPRRLPGTITDLAALRGGFTVNGVAHGSTGLGAESLDHPLNALCWLASHTAQREAPLQAGTIVSLGNVVKTIYPLPSSHVEASFDQLGTVTLTLD